MSWAIVTTLPLVLLFASAGTAETVEQGFRLKQQFGDPGRSQEWHWPQKGGWTSPDIFSILRQQGYTAADLLEAAGRDANWLLSRAERDIDWLVDRTGLTADQFLTAANEDADWLAAVLKLNTDAVLAAVGEDTRWLVDEADKSADWMLATAGTSRAWLIDELDKDADWILAQSNHSIDWMLGKAGKSVSWVRSRVKSEKCGGLPIGAKQTCEAAVEALSGVMSVLLGEINKDADWWLRKAGQDRAWLFQQTGENADWLLDKADRDRQWLLRQLGKNSAWLFRKAGLTVDWVLERSGASADVLLAAADKTINWLVAKVGRDANWVLAASGKSTDWLFSELGWRMEEAELYASVEAYAQLVAEEAFSIDYPGRVQVDCRSRTDNRLECRYRVIIEEGDLRGTSGLGAVSASAALTYKDPTGVTIQGTADPGIFNQDLAIIVNEPQQLYDNSRHSDDWLVTVCVPLKLIAAAAGITVPPASVAALLLVPDLIIQLSGTGGYYLDDEVVNPEPFRVLQAIVPMQRRFNLPVNYSTGARKYFDTENTTWGLAVGFPCGPGVGMSATIPIDGYSMVERVTMGASAEVQVPLPMSSITPPPPVQPQPMPRPAPGQPIQQRPPAEVTPELAPQVSPQAQPEAAPQVSPAQPETEQAPATSQQSPGVSQPARAPVLPR